MLEDEKAGLHDSFCCMGAMSGVLAVPEHAGHADCDHTPPGTFPYTALYYVTILPYHLQ